ncbi:ribosomal protein L1-like protein [Amylocarpus encephaloides]|uniref:Ribosomal protein L1-like protein n=1 Tax=Amylocarpus encephaloides TaxID=45428 RepID=A0A9P8C619_9HELO|nr:ribosomal protein L1-like protein [Amylocarpus encephaloides]
MSTPIPCLAQLSKACTSRITSTPRSLPIRYFSTTPSCRAKLVQKMVSKKGKTAPVKKLNGKNVVEKKKKVSTHWKQPDVSKEEQYSLLDAMRALRAWEVGQKPTSVKYEVALRLSGLKNGPVVRNRIRLPYPVQTDFNVCVICPPDSKYAEAARAAGAVLVGEDDVFEKIKEGIITFDRCICQADSLPKMNKSGVGRILGPKGLMPSIKTHTVVADPAKSMRDMIGASEYRERQGVVRMSVGQLGHTPDQLKKNIKSFMEALQKDISRLSDKIAKDVVEVVLSSTNGPGLPLNGAFQDAKTTVTEQDLVGS